MTFSIRRMGSLLVMLFVGAGCNASSSPPHRYVLPNGYVGFFSIKVDVKKGRQPPLVQGRRLFRIPNSGVLYIPDTSDFEKPHGYSAEYESGRQLSVEGANGLGEAALYSFVNTNSFDFLVGTEDDRLKAVALGPPFRPGPLPKEPVYKVHSGDGPTRYYKNGRRHGIETVIQNGRCIRQNHWVAGELILTKHEPPWFTKGEVAASRR